MEVQAEKQTKREELRNLSKQAKELQNTSYYNEKAFRIRRLFLPKKFALTGDG